MAAAKAEGLANVFVLKLRVFSLEFVSVWVGGHSF
jgi:hypothetical protein